MYADTVTKSMRQAIDETYRRRAKQVTYNEQHGITPTSITKAIDASLVEMYSPEWAVVPEIGTDTPGTEEFIPAHELSDRITARRREMMEAAENLDYEKAADLRDQIKKLERKAFGMDERRTPQQPSAPPGSAHQHTSDSARGRQEAHKTRDVSDKGIPVKTRGRRGAGAATGAAAGASGAKKQGRLKLIPDAPK